MFYSVLKKLPSCCVKPATLPKLEFTFNLNGEALKIHRYPQFTSLVEPSFQLSWRCRVYSCDFVKNALHHWDFLTWVLQDTSLKFGKTFCEVSLPFRLYSTFRFLRISLYLHGDVNTDADAKMSTLRFPNVPWWKLLVIQSQWFW